MTFNMAMDNVALGVATVEEARTAFRQVLREPSPAAARAVYSALRSWVWKALDSRRRDPELRDWHQLTKGLVGVLRRDFNGEAERIDVLADLIHEAVVVSEVFPMEAILQRQHVKEVLDLAHRKPDLKISRTELLLALGLKQANLSRVLNMMVMATLLRRIQAGKEAYFELTRAGAERASELKRVEPPLDHLKDFFGAICARTAKDDYSAPQTRLPILTLRRHTPRVERGAGNSVRQPGFVKNLLSHSSQPVESEKAHAQAREFVLG